MGGISNVIQNGLRHTFGNSGGEKQVFDYSHPIREKEWPTVCRRSSNINKK
ncbi:Fasciculation and elongation protein zeta-2 [Apodemus speciosus]|uniref:Fasciculation and elongation protein zeta-2 n=1 Tax=Apodemus speciosus TaxID=105296 RepID=A0ABQ0FW79_APOSI